MQWEAMVSPRNLLDLWITTGQYTFGNVRNFTYLGVLLNNRGTVTEEINMRIMTGNKACYANSQLLKSAFLSKSTEIKLYRTLIRLVVTYAMKTWTLNISDENALQILERKVIKKILPLFVKTVSGGIESTQKLIIYPKERT
jgi:hypothetical protein